MFTGIVEEVALVSSLKRGGGICRLSINSSLDLSDTRIGDSICIDGVCLTVVTKTGQEIGFDLSEETIRRTSLGSLDSGAKVNLERALKVGDRLGGHFVTGHVDSKSTLLSKQKEGESIRFEFELPKEIRGFVAEKGSIALSGISLTVGEISSDWFSVYIIPHTLNRTILKDLPLGGMVNIEVDLIARYLSSLANLESRSSRLTEEVLRNFGYIT